MIKNLAKFCTMVQLVIGLPTTGTFETQLNILDREYRFLKTQFDGNVCWRNSPNPFESSLPGGCSVHGTECQTRSIKKSYEISTPHPYPAQRNCFL